MEIIALSGYARAGKDEAANVLVEEFGFKRIGFADKLRDVLYQINPLVAVWQDWDGEPGAVFAQTVIDRYGWTGYKETMYHGEIRRLLQRLGTEAGRETLWDSIWVDAAFANLPDNAKVVIPDTRFINEATAVKERGGDIWRIRRKDLGPVNRHISETELDDWAFDIILDNNSTLDSYKKKIRSAMRYRDLNS